MKAIKKHKVRLYKKGRLLANMYVDAIIDKDKDIIHVVERVNGKRVFKDYPARYLLYYPDPRGKYESIFGIANYSVFSCYFYTNFL